tara:strand:- start:278 stop:661 length:384 start_codon:yes stop_codon:yes gene_type:complete
MKLGQTTKKILKKVGSVGAGISKTLGKGLSTLESINTSTGGALGVLASQFLPQNIQSGFNTFSKVVKTSEGLRKLGEGVMKKDIGNAVSGITDLYNMRTNFMNNPLTKTTEKMKKELTNIRMRELMN